MGRLEEYPIAAHRCQSHLVLTHHFSCGSIVAPREEVLVVGEVLQLKEPLLGDSPPLKSPANFRIGLQIHRLLKGVGLAPD